ncbi:hypothetical protein H312_00676 [Anncaliia algerae PRA339]|uniref:Transmembrane protein n=1 Tax=Anncaliia algerae PRA339 TaxID=1288291 RepID=A0A059F3Y6_9MICR|nr:hypothetical protein H312_00676 [Anncaliia algerae PRA339]
MLQNLININKLQYPKVFLRFFCSYQLNLIVLIASFKYFAGSKVFTCLVENVTISCIFALIFKNDISVISIVGLEWKNAYYRLIAMYRRNQYQSKNFYFKLINITYSNIEIKLLKIF